MQRLSKAALFAAAAAALLVGGGVTAAYFSNSTPIPVPEADSGEMQITYNDDCRYSYDAAGSRPLAEGDALIPGDNVYAICSYLITGQGDHLQANVVWTKDPSATMGGLPDGQADPPLVVSYVVASLDAGLDSIPIADPTENDCMENTTVTTGDSVITSDETMPDATWDGAAHQLYLSVRLCWPYGDDTTDPGVTMSKPISMSDITITLTQQSN
jgi:alternate signal-mediated exported protein